MSRIGSAFKPKNRRSSTGKAPTVKAPTGKAPTGKAPMGKAPTVKAPTVRSFPLFASNAGNLRELWLFLFFCVMAALLIFQLVQLQVFAAPWLQDLAVPGRQNTSVIPSKRGTIYDRNYNVLAQTVEARTVVARPKQVADPQRTADVLAMMLGGKAEDYYSLLTADTNYVVLSKAGDVEAGQELQQLDGELDKLLMRLKKHQDKADGNDSYSISVNAVVDAKLEAVRQEKAAEAEAKAAADAAAGADGAVADADGADAGVAEGQGAGAVDADGSGSGSGSGGDSNSDDIPADGGAVAGTGADGTAAASADGSADQAASADEPHSQFPLKAGGEVARVMVKADKKLAKSEGLAGRNPLYGIYYEKTTRREYPRGDIGRQVIGNAVYEVDEETGKEMLIGKYGIESQYDDLLTGSDGMTSAEYSKYDKDRPLSGLPIPGSERVEVAAVDGQDIVLSIDIVLQAEVEKKLSQAGVERNCDNGNALVLDGANGEILAAASLPLASRINLNRADSGDNGATNAKALSFAYEPGSTFKTLTAAALLEEGLVSPDDLFYGVSYSRQFAQDDIHDYAYHPDMDMSFRQIIARSSNVGTSLAKDRISDPVYAAYLEKFGLCEYTGVDLPGEERAWSTRDVDLDGDGEFDIIQLYNVLEHADSWPDSVSANISFGQGINVTSLQMASFYGAVANSGIQHRPHFLIDTPQKGADLSTRAGSIDDASTISDIDESVGIRIMKPETATTLQSLLRSVVTEGTGSKAQIDGYNVAGKTGTGQKPINGEYTNEDHIVSFAGFLEASDSKLVCITSMDNPDGALSDPPTGPLFASIMEFAAQRYMVAPTTPVG